MKSSNATRVNNQILYLLATILKTRGNKGELVCSFPPSGSMDLEIGLSVVLRRERFSRQARIESVRFVNGDVLVKFSGINSMTEAYGLIGCSLFTEREPACVPVEDESVHLLGWPLLDQNQRMIGLIIDILDRPLQPLLVVQDDSGREHLVPLVEEWLLEIDEVGRRVIMRLPEGLIGIN